MSRTRFVLSVLTFCLLLTAASTVFAQGYYERNVRRNPITGRLEVVPAPNASNRLVGPSRNYNDFYGARFNPYSGTGAQSRVRRNPVTGRLDVDNSYYNPWTGARMETMTRYNPITRRYETIQVVTPPNRLPAENAPADAPEENRTSRAKPRVIETQAPPSPDAPDFAPPPNTTGG